MFSWKRKRRCDAWLPFEGAVKLDFRKFNFTVPFKRKINLPDACSIFSLVIKTFTTVFKPEAAFETSIASWSTTLTLPLTRKISTCYQRIFHCYPSLWPSISSLADRRTSVAFPLSNYYLKSSFIAQQNKGKHKTLGWPNSCFIILLNNSPGRKWENFSLLLLFLLRIIPGHLSDERDGTWINLTCNLLVQHHPTFQFLQKKCYQTILKVIN